MNDLSYTPKGQPQQFPQMTLFEATQLHMLTPVVAKSVPHSRKQEVVDDLHKLRKHLSRKKPVDVDGPYVPELAKIKKQQEQEPDPKDFDTFEDFLAPQFLKKFHYDYKEEFVCIYPDACKRYIQEKRALYNATKT